MLWTSQTDQYFLLVIKKICDSKFTGLFLNKTLLVLVISRIILFIKNYFYFNRSKQNHIRLKLELKLLNIFFDSDRSNWIENGSWKI